MNGIPAVSGAKAEAAYEIGRLAVDVVRRDLRPSRVVTKEATENAAAAIAGTGGSTNGVLHLVAIAREFGIDFTIDNFDRISAATPIVADMKPWGRYHATDVYRAGGVGLVARELHKSSLIHAGVASVDGRRLADAAESVEETAGQTVVVPIETPLKSRGGVAIVRGNLAPEGCVVKLAGHDRREHRGPTRVFDLEEKCFAALKAGAIEPGDAWSSGTKAPRAAPACEPMQMFTTALEKRQLRRPRARKSRRERSSCAYFQTPARFSASCRCASRGGDDPRAKHARADPGAARAPLPKASTCPMKRLSDCAFRGG